MNLRELQTEAHAIAVDKGWYDTERTFGDCIALVHSELSEALEAYRARGLGGWVEPRVVEKDPPPPSWDRSAFTHDVLNKPCGVASELAAAVIRVADIATFYGVDLSKVVSKQSSIGPINDLYVSIVQSQLTFGEWITGCHQLLSQVVANGQSLHEPSATHLGKFLTSVKQMAAHYGIDLDAAIGAKMEYMREGARC